MTMSREWKGKWIRIYNGPSGILKLAAGNRQSPHDAFPHDSEI